MKRGARWSRRLVRRRGRPEGGAVATTITARVGRTWHRPRPKIDEAEMEARDRPLVVERLRLLSDDDRTVVVAGHDAAHATPVATGAATPPSVR